MNKVVIFILFALQSFFSIGSPLLYNRTIENNTVVTEIQNEKNSIVFLCPIKYLAKEKYIEKAKDLISNSSISDVTELKITLLFFLEDSEYFSGGPLIKMHTNEKDTTFIINDFEAIFLGFNNFEVCLQRKVTSRYYSFLVYGESNIFNVSAQKGITCFKSLDERIPFYQSILKEYFFPSYSLDEQISQLRDSIQTLNSKIEILEKTILEATTNVNNSKEIKNELPLNTDHIPENKKSIKTFFFRNEE